MNSAESLRILQARTDMLLGKELIWKSHQLTKHHQEQIKLRGIGQQGKAR